MPASDDGMHGIAPGSHSRQGENDKGMPDKGDLAVANGAVNQSSEIPSTGHGPKKRKRRCRRRKKKPLHAKVPLDGVLSGDGAPSSALVDENPASGQSRASEQARAPAPIDKPPAARHRPFQSNAYAALDLGTNNCRLLVAVPTRPGQFRVVDAYSRIVRLGEGMGATQNLSDAAMDRAVEALAACADKLKARPVRRMRLIATEACRAARNGGAFLKRVEAETGIQLEIVDRETEARLAVAGCASLVERGTDGLVLFDIGGGSSEIALIDLSSRNGHLTDNIVAWTSLPVGVVTLAEKFGGRDVTPTVFHAMKTHCARLIEQFEHASILDNCVGSANFALLGTSGTVTTLAGIHLGLARYDRRKVDGLWMADHEIDAIHDKLLGWTFEDRVANACIGEDRADLVMAGCAILEAIRERWPARRLRVADRGLREGLLTEMMHADKVWRRRGPWRKRPQQGHGSRQ